MSEIEYESDGEGNELHYGNTESDEDTPTTAPVPAPVVAPAVAPLGLFGLSVDSILRKSPEERSRIYEYLGLTHTAVRTPARQNFKWWKIESNREDCTTSRTKILNAIDSKKEDSMEAQQTEIFSSIHQLASAFAGIQIVVQGSTMKLTITDYPNALASVRRPPARP